MMKRLLQAQPFTEGKWLPFLLVLAVLCSGCASVSPLSISETSLEGYFKQQVAKFDKEQLASGSPVSVGLQEIDITVGPNGREVVVLEVDGDVALNALVARIPVAMSLTVEGAPVYDSNDHAIYIKRLNLIDSSIESGFFSGSLEPVTGTMMAALAQLLASAPVYRLDDAHWSGKLMAIADMDLKVVPGKLVFVPAD